MKRRGSNNPRGRENKEKRKEGTNRGSENGEENDRCWMNTRKKRKRKGN